MGERDHLASTDQFPAVTGLWEIIIRFAGSQRIADVECIIKFALTRFADSKSIMRSRQHGFRHIKSSLTNLPNF